MMKRFKAWHLYPLFILLLSVFFVTGCGDGLKNGHWLPGNPASTADITRPRVTAAVPLDNADNVAINTRITATFSEAMAPATINDNTFTVTDNVGTPVSGTVTPSGVNAVFIPDGVLDSTTTYTATITTGATDLAGNALVANFIWRFTTGTTLDNTAPTVILTYPIDNASGVATNSVVSAMFSKAMDPATIDNTTFTVEKNSDNTAVSGTVVYHPLDNLATFIPTSNLADNTTYRATVTTGAEDLAGNAIVSGSKPNPWTFTTGTGTAAASAVPLGTAAGFGIMATSAITNTGAATMINGDVSLDPGSSCGLLPVQVNGTIHINDTVSAQARIDLLAAYNTAKNLPPGTTVPGGQNLGAFVNGGDPGVLPPGTYTSGSTMLIDTPLVLDAGGNANAVWVFQIGSSLTSTTPGNVLLANGAQAKNVFWVPTASATIGVSTIFYGTIIAGVSATGQTNATINGRILAGAIGPGTIALDTNTVNVPAP